MSGGAAAEPVCQWLLEQALLATPLDSLIAGCGSRAVAAGLPVWRLSLAATLLHPQFESVSVVWHRAGPQDSTQHPLGSRQQAAFQNSPIARLLESGQNRMRYRLFAAEGTNEFPVLKAFRDQGATDYLALASPFGFNGALPGQLSGYVATWAGDRPGGFSDADLAALQRIQPALGVAVRVAIDMQIARAVLAAYLGRDAGARVLNGEIRRGALERLDAILFWADLGGFTALSGQLPGQTVVGMLDGYFEIMAAAVHRRGGQVLKLIGDGMLATFGLAGRQATPVAAAALDAAQDALAGVAAHNRGRSAAGQPTMSLDIALHLGEVMYGNVGADDRLDFTVIGPAVNEANRMEPLCGRLGEPLLASAGFVAALGRPDLFRSVGWHALKGIAEPRELFAPASAG